MQQVARRICAGHGTLQSLWQARTLGVHRLAPPLRSYRPISSMTARWSTWPHTRLFSRSFATEKEDLTKLQNVGSLDNTTGPRADSADTADPDNATGKLPSLDEYFASFSDAETEQQSQTQGPAAKDKTLKEVVYDYMYSEKARKQAALEKAYQDAAESKEDKARLKLSAAHFLNLHTQEPQGFPLDDPDMRALEPLNYKIEVPADPPVRDREKLLEREVARDQPPPRPKSDHEAFFDPSGSGPAEFEQRGVDAYDDIMRKREMKRRGEILPPPPKVRVRKIDKEGRAYGTGRRKTAIARVWIKAGSGMCTVNGQRHVEYFGAWTDRGRYMTPFLHTQTQLLFDVTATCEGGGKSGERLLLVPSLVAVRVHIPLVC